MKTLILYLDALGYRFISKENTPFLYNYGKENSLLRLKTLLAYTGIEHTFITGELPSESGIWTGFVYKKNYISHLIRANEITGLKLLTFHNLHYFNSFVAGIREKIKKGKM